jgi:hypothetical protein
MTQEQRELIQSAIDRIKEVQGHQTNAAGLKDYATLGYVWSKLQQAIRDDEKRKGA